MCIQRAQQLRSFGVPVPETAFYFERAIIKFPTLLCRCADKSHEIYTNEKSMSNEFFIFTHNRKNRPDIAIIGIGTLFPESSNATLFWKNIIAGKDLISDVPPSHWLLEDYYDPDPSTPDKTYGKRGGFLEDMPFNPIEWGIPPNIIPATDTTQLLALIVAKMCLQSAANGDFSHMDRSKMSVILGVTSAQELYGHMVSRLQRPVWQKVLRENGLHEQQVQEICDGISDEYQPWQETPFLVWEMLWREE